MEKVIVRPYSSGDRESVRRIAFDTALLGDSACAFFEDREMLSDFLTLYFLEYEPQSCFIAEADKMPVGYLLGATNSAVLNKTFNCRIAPRLLIKAFRHNTLFKRKNFIFVINYIKSFLKGEFKSPDFIKDYPACLHVNIKEGYRNQGLGTTLIAAYLAYLSKQKVKGVHFATLSDKAACFYEKLGFVLLYKSKRSYFRHILHKDIYCYVFGKNLE